MGAEWYYVKDGERHGPVALADVRRMARAGTLAPGDIVWSPAMANWTPAAQVSELMEQPESPAPAPRATPEPGPLTATVHAYEHAHAQPDAHAHAAAHAGAYDAMLAYRTSPQAGPVVASERALEMLRQTRPARVVAIILYISAGLCILTGCFGGLAVFAAPRDRWVGWVMLLYLPAALLSLVPATYLTRYASRISDVLIGRRELDLEEALSAQKSFWKFVGIAIVTVVGLNILGLLLFGLLLAIR